MKNIFICIFIFKYSLIVNATSRTIASDAADGEYLRAQEAISAVSKRRTNINDLYYEIVVLHEKTKHSGLWDIDDSENLESVSAKLSGYCEETSVSDLHIEAKSLVIIIYPKPEKDKGEDRFKFLRGTKITELKSENQQTVKLCEKLQAKINYMEIKKGEVKDVAVVNNSEVTSFVEEFERIQQAEQVLGNLRRSKIKCDKDDVQDCKGKFKTEKTKWEKFKNTVCDVNHTKQLALAAISEQQGNYAQMSRLDQAFNAYKAKCRRVKNYKKKIVKKFDRAVKSDYGNFNRTYDSVK